MRSCKNQAGAAREGGGEETGRKGGGDSEVQTSSYRSHGDVVKSTGNTVDDVVTTMYGGRRVLHLLW